MGDVSEYLKWRGDLGFDQDPLNEVDGLIFSILAYMDFSALFSKAEDRKSVVLNEIVEELEGACQKMREDDMPFLKDIPGFFTLAANTKRFGEVSVSRHVSQLDMEKAKQFSATVFSLNNKVHVAAFRGTDDSVAGWKEDMEMGYKSAVPAQQEGKVYLKEAMEEMEGVFYPVGHSKGGNLAIYAAACLPEEKKDFIGKIYNYDGPGFHLAFIQSDEYKSILDRVVTVLPESSVVGVLLEQKGRYKVIRCATDLALMQHNPFLWMLEGNSFVEAGKLSKTSRDIGETIQSWIQKLSAEDQEAFVNALFSVLEKAGIQRFAQMSDDVFSSALEILKAYSKTDGETKQHIKKVVDMLWDQGGKTLKRNITAEIGAVMEKNKKLLTKNKEEKNGGRG